MKYLISKWLIVVCLVAFSPLAWGQANTYIGSPKLYFGASYYPEAWDTANIDADIVRMKELHMNVMRMAEFAWAKMEPKEGQYDFGWLHRIVNKLGKNGIEVILGTPTATPPNWLWSKYPTIALTDPKGGKTTPGMRRDCSYSNDIYRKKSAEIAGKLAKEFGNDPTVIGWQTDNEMSLTYDYSNETKGKWVAWLRDNYKDVKTINAVWGLELWSAAYDTFEQVPMPAMSEWYHPSLKMAWMRFTNEELRSFQKLQLDAMRKETRKPITHDGMPGQKVEYEKLFSDLDFPAVNNYHSFEAYDLVISNYDRNRGYSKRAHWLFETAPNYSGGGENGSTWFLHLPDGSMKAALWMNYALGGQGAMYWLWRQQKTGQEMTHGAVLQAWGAPCANYADIKSLGEELEAQSGFMMANPVAKAKAGILYSTENANGLLNEKYANDLNYYKDWTYRFYLPMLQTGVHRDVINTDTPLDGYKLLFVPLAPYLEPKFEARLMAWVEAGGTLLMGPMTGYRTKEWTAYTDAAKGTIEKWSGVKTEAIIPIGCNPRPAEPPLLLDWRKYVKTNTDRAFLWAENYAGGMPLATYTSGMMRNKTAVAEVSRGKGKVVLLGTDIGKESTKLLIVELAKQAGIAPTCLPDAGVLAVPREGMIKATFLINLTTESKTCRGLMPGRDRMSNMMVGSEMSLKPFQTALIEHAK